jgi:hypothetical protein
MKKFIGELREWWEEWCWQNSPERMELATKRLSIYKKFMDKDPAFSRNPYAYPEDYDFE